MTSLVRCFLPCTLSLFGAFGYSQQPNLPPPLHPADKPSILFAVEDHTGEKDESGKPAQSTLDPIAFVVNGQFTWMLYANSSPNTAGRRRSPHALQRLPQGILQVIRLIQSGSAARPWGQAQATTASCIEDVVTPGDSPIDWRRVFPASPRPRKATSSEANLCSRLHRSRVKANPRGS